MKKFLDSAAFVVLAVVLTFNTTVSVLYVKKAYKEHVARKQIAAARANAIKDGTPKPCGGCGDKAAK